MTTLNGLPRSWDSFIQGICARKKLVNFNRLWEEFSQEEAREENMGSEDQALTVHSKKTGRISHHPRGKPFHKYNTRKYLSRIKCYTCDKKGHYAREFPRNKNVSHKNKGNKRRHHAHAAEDDGPSTKRNRQDSNDSSSDEEYVLIYTLMGTITHGSNNWIIDSGASKHMKGFKESFAKLFEHESPHKVKLGDDY